MLGFSDMSKHLVIIDGHHLMYRAYWAIPRTLKTRSGEQTNTSFGMASMLLAILAAEHPDGLVLCFDAGDETFRHQEHKEYKEGRAETPDDFYIQIPRVMELVATFGFPAVSDAKYEADDFLCAYAKAGEAAGMRVTIVTGDKDALQLASDKTKIAIPHKGDSSDTLPGVHGIGPKTAATLLQDYGSLAGVYEHLADIKPTIREKLTKDKEQAFFCERMAQLICDMPLPCPFADVMLRDIDPVPILTMFTALEFTMLARRFQKFLETDYACAHFRAGSLPAQVMPLEQRVSPDHQLKLFE